MTIIRGIYHIWHKDRKFVPGEIITSIDDSSAQQLVKDGAALFVNEPVIQPPKETIPLSPIENKDEEDDYKALDEGYTHEELKEMALTVDGLEFKSNILKKDLIHLIIDSGKVEAFFEEEA